MFVFKKSKADKAGQREATIYADVASTAAAMFLFFAALRVTCVFYPLCAARAPAPAPLLRVRVA
jgi:hypothetical protein